VNPDEVIAQYGADSFRLYEMFMGPLTAAKPWQTSGVEGVYRFLHRVWRMIVATDGTISDDIGEAPADRDMERVLHQTVRKVTEDTDSLDFNTAISQLMVCLNEFGRRQTRNREHIETFVKLLSPYAPHVAEELWQRLGHAETVAYEPWPAWDEEKTRLDEVEILVQVLGRPKARINMPADADAARMEQLALADEVVQKALQGKTVVKVIAVPGRLVNIVAK
jgi:leucyl-tRNA synthetase